MKKIALSLAVIATMAMVSCGNKAAENADSAADTAVVTEEVAVVADSDSNGQAAAVAVEETAAPAAEAAAPAAADAEKKDGEKAEAPAADKAEAPAEQPAK